MLGATVCRHCLSLLLWLGLGCQTAAAIGQVQNPVIFADFSDPDVIRHGDTYYLVSSSFNLVPGLPLLASEDLVNWQRLGYIVDRLQPDPVFSRPQHGKGVWAPCIRYHDGRFWVFYPDPDYGIYVTSAEAAAGPWSAPHLLLPGKGLIDPTPLWDDDGRAYLLHAWAKSRAGINNQLTLHRMSPDARTVLDEGRVVIDANQLPGFSTLEGPKFYKRNGYYYIFAPAGGVPEGWQTVFRARQIEGPYEHRVVLEQGMTDTNGPHQGAWVTDPQGRDWFYHFQDRGPFGRIVHLQQMRWQDDWPAIGLDLDGNGVGEPQAVLPLAVAQRPLAGLPLGDEFNGESLGGQWQWHGNWRDAWFSLREQPGSLRLLPQPAVDGGLWQQPALLTQMVPGPAFTATAALDQGSGDRDPGAVATGANRGGLVLFGFNIAWLGIRSDGGRHELVYETCVGALGGCEQTSTRVASLAQPVVEVRVAVAADASAVFSYRLPGSSDWQAVAQPPFAMREGRWVGARVGLFAEREGAEREGGGKPLDVNYFRVVVAEPP